LWEPRHRLVFGHLQETVEMAHRTRKKSERRMGLVHHSLPFPLLLLLCLCWART
jgi:hypothetical protein